MAKFMGFSANRAGLAYIRDNADVLYLAADAAQTIAALSGNGTNIVSSNISGADITIASGAAGAVLTIGAKNSQPIGGSGTATHLYIGTISAGRLLFVTTVSSQVLASGNTASIGAITVTAFASASN
ncbi:MAG: hypothetical protein ACREXR_00375 [Gammaproteobacteria bacterium]